jgi:hypothetical protein
VRLWITTAREIFMFGHNRQLSVALSLASPGLVIREHHSPNEFLSATTWSAERTGPAPRCLLPLVTPRHVIVGEANAANHSLVDLANLFRPLRVSIGRAAYLGNFTRPFTVENGASFDARRQTARRVRDRHRHVAAHRAGGDHWRRFRAASRLLGVATNSLTVF